MTLPGSENNSLSEKTKSLNQSGAFLQVHILDELQKRGWETLAEYPIRLSPFVQEPRNHQLIHSRSLAAPGRPIDPTTFVRAAFDSMSKSSREETIIDIVAARTIERQNVVNLCIESKKLDPRFMDWVFFQLEEKENDWMRLLERSRSHSNPSLFTVSATTTFNVETYLGITRQDMGRPFRHPIADFAISLKNRQVETDYYKSDKTKIDESARQIIGGAYGYIVDRILNHVPRAEPILSNSNDYFVPIVVTNANLYLCNFNRDKIDPASGHLIQEPEYQIVESIIYECPPPKNIQFPDLLSANLSPADAKISSKWHVLILSPKGLVNFLTSFNT